MFNSKNFSVMSYANGFTLWNYTTDDSLSAVKKEGYFNEAAPFARKGDMILIAASKASVVEAVIVFVKDVSAAAVEIEDIVPAASASDSQASGDNQ